jgi:hypothetical protein
MMIGWLLRKRNRTTESEDHVETAAKDVQRSR